MATLFDDGWRSPPAPPLRERCLRAQTPQHHKVRCAPARCLAEAMVRRVPASSEGGEGALPREVKPASRQRRSPPGL
eukprot:7836119-Alexandrium_andersonii.AAC.1